MAISAALKNLFAAFYSHRTNSAGGVVVGAGGKILVVNQRGRSWSLPKGHVDKNETKLDAAKREIYEETGIKHLELVKELGSYTRHKMGKKPGTEDIREIKTITIFLFHTNETKTEPIFSDSWEAIWLTPEGAVGVLSHPKDKEFLREHLGDLSKTP